MFMKKLFFTISLIAFSSVSFAECNYPKKKFDIPSGKKATEAEMVETMGKVKQFQADLAVYRTCLDDELAKVSPELDGLDANTLLTEVFVSCDRLRRDHRDDTGVGEILRLTPLLTEHRPPFGIEANIWDEIGKRSIDLVDLLSEGSGDEEEIKSQAGGLAEILRSMT